MTRISYTERHHALKFVQHGTVLVIVMIIVLYLVGSAVLGGMQNRAKFREQSTGKFPCISMSDSGPALMTDVRC